MKHTKGPWEFSPYHKAVVQSERSLSSGQIIVANMPPCAGPVGSGLEKGYNEPNAHLIAAAPEMLEALISAVWYLDEELRPPNYVFEGYKAAIRKARGEL